MQTLGIALRFYYRQFESVLMEKELTAKLRYYAGENVWASPQAPFINWNLCVPQGVATQVCTFW